MPAAFLENKLTLYPGRSLIRNIGNDSSGTHCGSTRQMDVHLWMEPVHVSQIPIEENRLARSAFEGFFASTHRPLLARLINHLLPNRRHPIPKAAGRMEM